MVTLLEKIYQSHVAHSYIKKKRQYTNFEKLGGKKIILPRIFETNNTYLNLRNSFLYKSLFRKQLLYKIFPARKQRKREKSKFPKKQKHQTQFF